MSAGGFWDDDDEKPAAKPATQFVSDPITRAPEVEREVHDRPRRIPEDHPAAQGKFWRELDELWQAQKKDELAAKIKEIGRPQYGHAQSFYGYAVYDPKTGEVDWWGKHLDRVTELIVRKVGHEGVNKKLEIRDAHLIVFPRIFKPEFR